jgi:hypothetical protein
VFLRFRYLLGPPSLVHIALNTRALRDGAGPAVQPMLSGIRRTLARMVQMPKTMVGLVPRPRTHQFGTQTNVVDLVFAAYSSCVPIGIPQKR